MHGRGTLRYARGNAWEARWRVRMGDAAPAEMAHGASVSRRSGFSSPSMSMSRRRSEASSEASLSRVRYADEFGVIGNVFEGDFRRGEIEGFGTFTCVVDCAQWPIRAGESYAGEWRANRWSGWGVLRHADSSTQEGEWRDCVFVPPRAAV